MATGKHFTFKKFLIVVAIFTVAIVGSVFLAIWISGMRYVSYHTEDHGTIKYIGKLDVDGDPCDGRVYYADGSKAKISEASASLEYKNGDICADGKYFKIEYDNDNVYVGEVDGLLRNGNGILTFSGGDVYEGEFKYDQMYGEGSYYYVNGDVYVGDFVLGVKSGEGKYTWVDFNGGSSDVYIGEFANNMRNGKGTYVYSDGTVYTGEYVNDSKYGMGTMTYSDGDVYVGEFYADMRHGKGTYTFASGDVYVGEFNMNAITGYGTYTWADGSRADYTGYFEDGVIVVVEESETSENTSEE